MNALSHVLPAVTDTMEDHQTETSLEALREVHSIERQIAAEQVKVSALNSAIEMLETHKGPLLPFQLQMLDIVASTTGAQLGHQKAGIGLEAYSGPRASTMLTLTLEGFKETFRKVIEWIMKLFRKLKSWVKKVFNGRKMQLNQALSILDTPHRYSIRRPSEGGIEAIAGALSIGDRFKPTEIVKNTRKVAQGLSSEAYVTSIKHYSDEVIAIVNTFLKETSDQEGNWRRHVDLVNKLDLPIPPTFEESFSQSTHAVYSSLPLIGGGTVSFIGVSKGNDQGAKGARARAQALAGVRIGNQAELKAATEAHEERELLEDYRRSSYFKGDVSLVKELIRDATKMIDHGYHIENVMDESDRAATTFLKADVENLPTDVHAIVTNLIHSMGSIAQTASKVIDDVAKVAISLAHSYIQISTL